MPLLILGKGSMKQHACLRRLKHFENRTNSCYNRWSSSISL
jgi:hypothetical protein